MVKDTVRYEVLARHVFKYTCRLAHTHLATGLANGSGFVYPIALHTSSVPTVTALATEDIFPGCLVIPVLCTRDTSYLTPQDKGSRSNHEVTGLVKWKQPVDESSEKDVEIKLYCQPERKQPPQKDNMNKPDYGSTTDCHPFWHIRRSNEAGTCNSAVVGLEIKVITSSHMTELKTDAYDPIPGC